MSVHRPAFGALLRQLRTVAGLTQEELAERAGLSVRGISDLERGERGHPRRDTVRMLADALLLTGAGRATFASAAGISLAPGTPNAANAAPSSNLPHPTTPLIGREEDVAAIVRLLSQEEVRLVNLTGPGGVGKTRLAIQVATELRAAFPDGIYFVALAALRDEDLILPTVGRVVGVRDASDQPLRERILAYLRERRALILFDNFEHLLPGALLLAELLSACPYLTVLTTSRATLHLSGEYEVAVQPFTLPDHARLLAVETLVRYPAIRLFVERARAADAAFVVGDANAIAITEICRRLDGLPLAIELAAARVRLLQPQAILDRLQHPLTVLTGGARDLPTRQQTLRQTVTWSHELLDPREQILFRRLAIFVGGWSIEAAAVVCAQEGTSPADPLDEITSLREKNLVRVMEAPGESPRFTMLETIREYAQERLIESDELAALQQRHAAWALRLAEHAETHLFGPEQTLWFDHLEREHSNIREALRFAFRDGASETGVRLAGALAWFWLIRGHLREGSAWLAHAAMRRCDDAARAKVLLGAGMLAWAQGEYARAHAWCMESLHLSESGKEWRGAALALSYLARIGLEIGDYQRTISWSERAAALFAARDEPWGIVFARAMLGRVAWATGDHAGAIALFEELLGIARTQGDTRGIAFILSYLGGATLAQGDYARAAAFCAESRAQFEELGDRRGVGYALMFLASGARERGDLALATDLYGQCLTLLRDFGPRVEIAWALEEYALLWVLREEAARALSIAAAAAALRTAIGAPLAPVRDEEMRLRLTAAWQSLADRADVVWEYGQRLSIQDAIEIALGNRPYQQTVVP